MTNLDARSNALETSDTVFRADVAEVGCECMVCDLPLGQDHGPVQWRMTVDFPGPYPFPGTSVMLLCDHCKDSWLGDDWPEPFNNFIVARCVRV